MPRPDLGGVDGELNNGQSSDVKGIIMLNTGTVNLDMIDDAEVLLFTFHQTGDPSALFVASLSDVPCVNQPPFYLQDDIVAKASTVGYIENDNMKTLSTQGTNHEYSHAIVDSIGAFIQANQ